MNLAAGQRDQAARRPRGEVETLEQLGADSTVTRRLAAEVAAVRRAPEQDIVRDLHVSGQHGVLWNEGDGAGEPALGVARRRLPVEVDDATVRDEAGDGAKQRCLPGSVGPDQPDPRAGVDSLGRVRDREHRPVPDREVVQLDHQTLRCARFDRRTKRKNGAPMKAVTTPIGTSAGAWTVRATTSASMRNAAPPIIETGSTTR